MVPNELNLQLQKKVRSVYDENLTEPLFDLPL